MQKKNRTIVLKLTILVALFLFGCGHEPDRTSHVSEIKFSCKKPVIYVFINGIMNEFKDSNQSKADLSTATGKDFVLLQNETEGRYEDLIQSFRQKRAQGDIKWVPDIMIELFAAALSFADRHPDSIYTDNEKSSIEEFLDMSNDNRLFVVAHSQGNFFANDICSKAVTKPEIHSFATPASRASKCEEKYYTYTKDPISFLGRTGNYVYNEGAKYKDYAASSLFSPLLKATSLDFFFHSFENYLDNGQRPIKELKNKLPKDDSEKAIIEKIMIKNFEGVAPVSYNGRELTDKITCKDVSSSFVNLISPTLVPFHPSQIFGFVYQVKMPGKNPVYLIPTKSKTSHYTLSITKDESDKSSPTNNYIIKDAGLLPAFGVDPAKEPPKNSDIKFPSTPQSSPIKNPLPPSMQKPAPEKSRPPLKII